MVTSKPARKNKIRMKTNQDVDEVATGLATLHPEMTVMLYLLMSKLKGMNQYQLRSVQTCKQILS